MPKHTAFVSPLGHGGRTSPREGLPAAGTPQPHEMAARGAAGAEDAHCFHHRERRNHSSAGKAGRPRSFSSRQGPPPVPLRSLPPPAVPSTTLAAPHPLLTQRRRRGATRAHNGEREAAERERGPLVPLARPSRKEPAHRRAAAARSTPGCAAMRGAGAVAELAGLCACSEGGGAAGRGGGTAGAGG